MSINWKYIDSGENDEGKTVSNFKHIPSGHIETVVLSDIEAKCMTFGQVFDKLLRQVGEYSSKDGLAGMVSSMFK